MSPWEAITGVTQQGPRAGRPCSPVPALTVSHAGCGRRSEVPGGLPLAGTSGPSPLTLGLAGTSKNLPWSWPSPSTCPTSGARTYRCSSGSGIAESRPARVSLGDTGGQSGEVSGKMWRLSQLAWTGAGGEGPHGQGPLWEDILPPRVRKWGRWGGCCSAPDVLPHQGG